MAAALVTLIPVILMFLALQKYFVEGVATSGIKG
jgi:multiple sugar transport system permease protein